MKMKRQISLMFTVTLLMTMLMTTCVFAGDQPFGTLSPLLPVVTPEAPEGVENMVLPVMGMIVAIGNAVAAGMLIYVGIKYTLASANEKADLKTASIRYVIGAVILLGASGVMAIIEKVIEEIAPVAPGV